MRLRSLDITRKSFAIAGLLVTLLTVPGQTCRAESESAKPIIGINMDVEPGSPKTYRILPDYVNAISKSGGIPVVIPPMPESQLPELLSSLDGVMMIGGNDYPPSLYKQEKHESVRLMDEDRTNFDLALVRAVLKNGRIPFLGICAGSQVLNIASGGSLVQDIPTHYTESKVQHASPKGWQVGFNKHHVKPVEGTTVCKIIGASGLNVVTSHHQCVDKVGEGLRVAARTDDGVIESIESTDKDFVVGVQWHPERDFDNGKVLFNEFINRSKRMREARSSDNAM